MCTPRQINARCAALLDIVHPQCYIPSLMTLRELREDCGWSMYDLAVEAEISKSMVAMIESGTREPSLGTVRALAGALGITSSQLVAALECE